MTDKKSSKDTNIHNRHFVASGDPVIKQGDKGNEAYLIQSGKVRVYAEHAGKTVELGTLGPGDIFGEMALIVDDARTATVETLENSNFIVITRPMMIERLAKTDPLIKALVPMLLKRIQEGNSSALNRREGFGDLVEAVNSVYQSVHDSLDSKQKTSLERLTKPQLDAFIKAIEDFQKLYNEE